MSGYKYAVLKYFQKDNAIGCFCGFELCRSDEELNIVTQILNKMSFYYRIFGLDQYTNEAIMRTVKALVGKNN